jgi:hypothetical protein
MLQKIAHHVFQRYKQESEKKKKATYQINVEYVEGCLQKLFSYRQSDILSQRVRFKIQDLIDEYDRQWRETVSQFRMLVDEDGFQMKYVPKDAIISEENKKKNSEVLYVKKEQSSESPVKGMKELLKSLKPDDNHKSE